VAQLVTGYFGENYCEKLIDTADSSINVDKVALYLSMIGWESEAASKLTSESVDKWLQSKDLTRLRVALSQEIEWLPFKATYKSQWKNKKCITSSKTTTHCVRSDMLTHARFKGVI